MAQAIVVCYALFNPLFAVVVLARCGKANAKIHFDHLINLAMSVNAFLLTIFLIPIVSIYTSS
jgi:hypothetical protein